MIIQHATCHVCLSHLVCLPLSPRLLQAGGFVSELSSGYSVPEQPRHTVGTVLMEARATVARWGLAGQGLLCHWLDIRRAIYSVTHLWQWLFF